MKQIFINLKRFDVAKRLGGICSIDNPVEWIEWVIDESVSLSIGKLDGFKVVYLLPESLIPAANARLSAYNEGEVKTIGIGCQGVFRENVKKGGNFGAFTTNLPAAAAANLGCEWSIIGHSEERKDKLGIISAYDPLSKKNEENMKRAKDAVDSIINNEVICALESEINVLLCVGETLEEKGEGSFDEQKPRIEKVLRSQLNAGLKGIDEWIGKRMITIGYEPIWAIGPGKIPPGEEYIGFVSAYIKSVLKQMYGVDFPVVYGGGLKEENAGMISGIDTIDGGLVALTRFSGDIAFEPDGLRRIINKYIG
jgi:triosephosphate isomerase